MGFYKSVGASLKEVQDGDFLCTFPISIFRSHHATGAVELVKPEILRENRNQIFFIRSSRLLGDKFRGRNIYFTIKPESDCYNCIFRVNGMTCALKSKESREQIYYKSLIEQYAKQDVIIVDPCTFENVHFDEYKM